MKVAILGFGRQGKIVARDMAQLDSVRLVSVADVGFDDRDEDFNYIEADLSDYGSVSKICEKHDLVVGCLPARLGNTCLFAAIDANVNYVDLSFMEENQMALDSSALRRHITVVPDAGIAPGISNLVAGRAIHMGAKNIEIHVGGIARDRRDDYVLTWSPEDLEAEYTRPARVVVEGSVREVKPLEWPTTLDFPGVGKVSSYATDGLRTMLQYADRVENMVEKTIRWPGHIEDVVRPMLHSGNFQKNAAECFKSVGEADDVLLMVITADDKTVRLKVNGDGAQSAMSRATAHSCSSFAALMTSGIFRYSGVAPGEVIAKFDDSYRFILDNLSKHGIEFDTKYPFM